MVRISSTEFGNSVGRYQDMALSEAIMVTRNGRDRVVMISADEYQRLKRRDREVMATADLSAGDIEAVRTSAMDVRHDHLNALLTDWKP